MRTPILVTALAGTLMLGGCATAYGDPLGGLLGGILGGGNTGNYNSGSNMSEFERAAYEACARQASQYGSVQVTDVRQDSNSTVRVLGRINTRDTRRDEFTCTFRSDGRIVDFRLG